MYLDCRVLPAVSMAATQHCRLHPSLPTTPRPLHPYRNLYCSCPLRSPAAKMGFPATGKLRGRVAKRGSGYFVVRSNAASLPEPSLDQMDVVKDAMTVTDDENAEGVAEEAVPAASVWLTNFQPQRAAKPSHRGMLQTLFRLASQIPQYIARVIAFRLQQIMLADLWVKTVAYFLIGIPAIIAGAFMYCAASGKPLWVGLKKAYGGLYKVPGVGVLGEGSPQVELVMNIIWFVGTFSFALILGLLTEEVMTIIKGVRTGNYPLPFNNHVVLCGWNKLLLPIVRQINVAHSERGSAFKGPLVVLANHDKAEMDAKLRDVLSAWPHMEWYTRKGFSFDVTALAKVNAASAHTVMVLPPEDEVDVTAASEQQLSTLLALNSVRTHSRPALFSDRNSQHVLVQLPDTDNDYDRAAFIAAKKVIVDSDSDMQLTYVESVKGLSRLMAQSAAQPGVASVIASILQQTLSGAEFYVKKVNLGAGVQYKDLRQMFSDAVVCGYLSEAKSILHLNPKDTDSVSPGDSVLALAKNADFGPVQGKPLAPEYLEVLSNPQQRGPTGQAKDQMKEEAKTVLILAVGGDVADVVSSVVQYVTAGSRVVCITEQEFALEMQESKMLKVSYSGVNGRPTDAKILEAHGVTDADSVVIVTEEQAIAGKLVDAQLHSVLLALRDCLVNTNRRKGWPLHVIASVHSPTSSMVANDLLSTLPSGSVTMECVQPEELLAGMTVQMAAGRVVGKLLKNLSCEGGVVSLIPVYSYMWDYHREVTFAEVSERVRQKGHTAIGFVSAMGDMVMSPHAGWRHKFHSQDRLVVVTSTSDMYIEPV